MAIYISDIGENRLERQSATAVFTLNALVANKRATKEYLLDGDMVLVGRLPDNALCRTALLKVSKQSFPVGTTLDIGRPTYSPTGEVTGLTVMDTIGVDGASGEFFNIELDEIIYNSGGVESGEKLLGGGTDILVRINLPTPLTADASVRLLFPYDYIGGKSTGAYTH